MLLGRSNCLRISPPSLVVGRFPSGPTSTTPSASSPRPSSNHPRTRNSTLPYEPCRQRLASAARSFSSSPSSPFWPFPLFQPRHSADADDPPLPAPSTILPTTSIQPSEPPVTPPDLTPPEPPTPPPPPSVASDSPTDSSPITSSSSPSPSATSLHDYDPQPLLAARTSLLQSLSAGTVRPPTPLLDLLLIPRTPSQPSPPLDLVRETTELLFVRYVEVYFLLSLRKDPSEQEAREALVKAALKVESGWEKLLSAREELVNDRKREDGIRELVPELVRICVELEDWDALKLVVTAGRDIVNPKLSDQLQAALLGYLSSPSISSLPPNSVSQIVSPIIAAIFKPQSSSRPTCSGDLRAVWRALASHPTLVSVRLRGHLFGIAIERKDAEMVALIWEKVLEVNRAFQVAELAVLYIDFLASSGNTSQILPLLQLLIDREFVAIVHWQQAFRSMYTSALPSDKLPNAIRFILDEAQPKASEEIALLLMADLCSWRKGGQSFSDDRVTLKEAFGADVWERVNNVEAEDRKRGAGGVG